MGYYVAYFTIVLIGTFVAVDWQRDISIDRLKIHTSFVGSLLRKRYQASAAVVIVSTWNGGVLRASVPAGVTDILEVLPGSALLFVCSRRRLTCKVEDSLSVLKKD